MGGGASIVSLGSFTQLVFSLYTVPFGMIASSVLIMQQQSAGKFTVFSSTVGEGLSPHISYKIGDSRPMFEARCSSEGNTVISPNGIVTTPPIWNIDILWPPRGLLSGGEVIWARWIIARVILWWRLSCRNICLAVLGGGKRCRRKS